MRCSLSTSGGQCRKGHSSPRWQRPVLTKNLQWPIGWSACGWIGSGSRSMLGSGAGSAPSCSCCCPPAPAAASPSPAAGAASNFPLASLRPPLPAPRLSLPPADAINRATCCFPGANSRPGLSCRQLCSTWRAVVTRGDKGGRVADFRVSVRYQECAMTHEGRCKHCYAP